MDEKLRAVIQLNEDGNLDSINPIAGLLAMAKRRGMDCEVVMLNFKCDLEQVLASGFDQIDNKYVEFDNPDDAEEMKRI